MSHLSQQQRQDILSYRRDLFEYAQGRAFNLPPIPASLLGRDLATPTPCCPPMPGVLAPATPYAQSAQPIPSTPDELRAAADALQADLDRQEEHAALAARIDYERALAVATQKLLEEISAEIGVTPRCSAVPACSEAFALFRKVLQPLARTYGVKITLVGDKTKATLVRL